MIGNNFEVFVLVHVGRQSSEKYVVLAMMQKYKKAVLPFMVNFIINSSSSLWVENNSPYMKGSNLYKKIMNCREYIWEQFYLRAIFDRLIVSFMLNNKFFWINYSFFLVQIIHTCQL